MKEFRRLLVVIPAVALAVLLALLYLGRGTMDELAFLRQGAALDAGPVDQRPSQTAETLAEMATSAEEQKFAQSAQQLADHEVDQAFAMALRQASIQPRVLTGDAAAAAARVDALKQTVKGDQAKVDALMATLPMPGGAPAQAGGDLDVAKAQLQLDTDELTDAGGELVWATGDQRGRIEQELAAHEAEMKKAAAGVAKKETAVAAVKRHGTLWGRVNAWFDQRSRAKLVAQAQQAAQASAKDLAQQHGAMEQEIAKAAGTAPASVGPARVKQLQQMASRREIMSILDDRTQTQQQLATVYGRWERQVWLQHRILGYLLLESLAWVSFVVLAAALLGVVGRLVVDRIATEPREAHTLKTILTLALEAAGLAGVLLVTFGVPDEMPAILGLSTAALTVVFQDFILSFFGWFVLMGKNGIRVSDWVEIDGVGGEVESIGLFKTVLLETGNWTSRGHPTGRRMAFTNSFAIRGRYFNFSTHGQWMWDEITLNVAATGQAYELIKKMQEAVEKETAQNSELATLEWEKATSDFGLRHFSAKPTVDLRPAATGVDVIVRFVTRASDRFGLRNKIYEALLGLMEGTERPGLPGAE